VAALLQIGGHIVRAYRARLLLSPIKESTARFQFRALSVGYLFNTVLPLRIGELIRARIIAGAENISFGYALTLIIFERAFDALLLGLVGLCIVFGIVGAGHIALLPYITAMLAISGAIFIGIVLLLKENVRVIRIWFVITGSLNDMLKHAFRFKAWSIIYGLQQTMKPRLLIRYAGLGILSWILYASSMFVLVQYFVPATSIWNKTILTASPYYGVAIPSGPASLGAFTSGAQAVNSSASLTSQLELVFNLTAWAVLVFPIAFLGLVLLLWKTKESLWQKRPKQASAHSLQNKLSRSEDISSEMANFLENYFSGNTLSRIVHRLEQRDNFRLMKYFKGGSDAITILALQDGKQVVKKIIPLEFQDRLKAQHDWLKKYDGVEGIVKVLAEEKAKDHYAIDLAYDPEDVMLFDFMHRNPINESKRVLDEVWGYLFKNVYGKPAKLALHTKSRDEYIKKHITGCFDKAAIVDPELLRAVEPDRILINGKEYDNLSQILKKIKKHPEAWSDIATYQETSIVHGDVAVDNILVHNKTGKARLIDPAPDGNVINGPVFDFGKNMQALYCGYEFMLRDGEAVFFDEEKGIQYRDNTSSQYKELCRYIQKELAPKYLSESELKAIIFHAGALYIRRLKHQVYYNPANVLKFYAIGVKTLNDFLGQYEQK
jgi:hypothetical protein